VGPLGESGDSWLGRSGSGYVASRHLQGCSPRLCRLRTVWLPPMSKYWTYRSHADDMTPVNLVAYCWWVFGFLHCFIGWLGRETRYRPADRSAGVLGIVSGALFLRSSDSVQPCRRLVEGCHVWGPPAGSIHWAYVDWCGKHMCHVGRVYIHSNRRDSRIWVTACLWQSSRSNLMTWWMVNLESWRFDLLNCLQPLLD
jgi:hypothetical protein